MSIGSEGPVAVGFSNLPSQAHRKAVKKGFELTIMVVGESGLGKSTLISSLFLLDSLHPETGADGISKTSQLLLDRTTKIESHSTEIEEGGIKVRLTVVDTPGYGDGLDCTQDIAPIIRYVDEQFERYFRDESGLNRRNISDTRVHCCLYFVAPSGCGLKPMDREFMRLLQNKVNIVPVIAKADTLTAAELAQLKSRLLEQIRSADLKVFSIPEAEVEEDIEYKRQCTALKAAMPFGVVGADSPAVEARGRRVRGRVYPWGVVEIENPDHCDFVRLRTLLTAHMGDLRDTTHDTLYEAYRAQRLLSSAGPTIDSTTNNNSSLGQQQQQQQSSSSTSGSAASRHQNQHHHHQVDDQAAVDKERQLAEKERELRELERRLKKQLELQQQQQQQQQQQPNSVV